MSQYVEELAFDKNLRLGDVISGFSHVMPTFDDFFNAKNEFRLDIKEQLFFTVLTPCCSIEEKLITVVPLKEIKYSIIDNPFYSEDITRINRPHPPEKAYPPAVWKKLTEEQQQKKISEGDGYALFSLFSYSSSEKLPFYELRYKSNPPVNLNVYMIDFKEAFTIASKKIQRGNTYPKILQLSIKSRDELRNKLAYFYSRVPDEDKV